uniref:Uncharacterized protein n=1 Tax=Opuntia streptacantha TaxID=393608 RepID=A0A7C8ZPW1_OPUST
MKVSFWNSYGSFNQTQIHSPILVVLHCSWVNPTEHRNTTILIYMDVGVVSENDFTSPYITVHKHTDEIAHGSRRNKQRRLFAHYHCHLCLKAEGSGVIA